MSARVSGGTVKYALIADVGMPGMEPRSQRLEFSVSRELLEAQPEYGLLRMIAERQCESLAWSLKGSVRLTRLERQRPDGRWENRCFAVPASPSIFEQCHPSSVRLPAIWP